MIKKKTSKIIKVNVCKLIKCITISFFVFRYAVVIPNSKLMKILSVLKSA